MFPALGSREFISGFTATPEMSFQSLADVALLTPKDDCFDGLASWRAKNGLAPSPLRTGIEYPPVTVDVGMQPLFGWIGAQGAIGINAQLIGGPPGAWAPILLRSLENWEGWVVHEIRLARLLPRIEVPQQGDGGPLPGESAAKIALDRAMRKGRGRRQ